MVSAMSTRADIQQDVLSFVQTHLGHSHGDLSGTTRLGADLGLDGDDASEFMTDFAKTFEVDLSEFSFVDHFSVESGLNPIGLLVRLFTKGKRSEAADVRIDDLVRAAEAKKWSEE